MSNVQSLTDKYANVDRRQLQAILSSRGATSQLSSAQLTEMTAVAEYKTWPLAARQVYDIIGRGTTDPSKIAEKAEAQYKQSPDEVNDALAFLESKGLLGDTVQW